uniref:Uncharacterized protein n=1 Tax=Alexandrium andersonii TaxID=327968 RepID=A0A7S2AED1_9DINO
MNGSSAHLQETKVGGVSALGSNHMGMDLPLGGLGNFTPNTPHGQLYVGPSGTPFRRAWMQKGSMSYLKGVQHGHLYMRWDELGGASSLRLEAASQETPTS